MFDDLGYCTRVEHKVLKISHDGVIMDKWSKICWLYILEGFNVFVHSSSHNEDFHDKNNLWDLRSRHGKCMKVVLEHFNEFFYETMDKTHLIVSCHGISGVR